MIQTLSKIIQSTLSPIAKKIYLSDYTKIKLAITRFNETDYTEEFVRYENSIKILISGEDHRFKLHPGFDAIAILRAMKQKLLYNKKEGASTIDQQLVRVLTGDFRPTWRRKFKEILLATVLPNLMDRKYVPLLYLKVAYYGNEMNNLSAYIFKKKLDIKKITLADSAELVSRIKYPEPKEFSQTRNEKIAKRVCHLLQLYHKHSENSFLSYHKI